MNEKGNKMGYPNMSYCMCENTVLALRQVMGEMEDAGSLTEFVAEMSRSEKQAFQELFNLCESFIRMTEDMDDGYGMAALEQNDE
jgi:hypothetical protein